MDDVALGSDPDRRHENELAAMFDAPAYVRRARRVHGAFDALLAEAGQRRDEYLAMPRLRIGRLHALAGGYAELLPWLAGPAEVAVLEILHETLSPRLRLPPSRTKSWRVLAGALGQLVDSLTRFNRRWAEYVGKLDLGPINALRDGYNRYYVLEKACSLCSDLLARHGFVPLPPLDADEILAQLPLLPVPRQRS